jgi:hypothetical protein
LVTWSYLFNYYYFRNYDNFDLFFFFFLREARPSLDGLPSNLTRSVWFGLGWVVVSVRFWAVSLLLFFWCRKRAYLSLLSTSSFFNFFIIALIFFLLGMLWSMSYYEFVILIQDVLKKKIISKYIKII